jgi:monoamine oxidase
MRTWGPSGAVVGIRRAQAVSRVARQTGCDLDEAREVLARQMSRRGFLATAGAGAIAGLAVTPNRLVANAGGRGSPRVVIVGAGIAGLGCAYRLWTRYGIKAQIYEFNSVPGGRIRTLRGFFSDGQIVEEHAEFVNPEHTATLALAKRFGLQLDNTDKYRPGTHPGRETMRFHGRRWSQTALDRDWHEWGWKLFITPPT